MTRPAVLLLLKASVRGYTRADGTPVRPHQRRTRPARPPAPAQHPAAAGTWLHGTAGDHQDFSDHAIGSVTSNTEPGFWFTRSMLYASQYAQSAAGQRGAEPRIMEATLQLTNPLVVQFNEDMEPVVNGEVQPWRTNLDIIRYAKDEGHDGVIFPDGNFAEESEAAVVFRSTDITIHPGT